MVRNTNALLLMAAVLLGLVTLAGCERAIAIPPDAAEPVVLQTYDVPPEYRDELRTMLRSALGTDDNSIGRVTTGPGGTLLVVATPRIQAGVAEILEMGFDAPPATALRKRSPRNPTQHVAHEPMTRAASSQGCETAVADPAMNVALPRKWASSRETMEPRAWTSS